MSTPRPPKTTAVSTLTVIETPDGKLDVSINIPDAAVGTLGELIANKALEVLQAMMNQATGQSTKIEKRNLQ